MSASKSTRAGNSTTSDMPKDAVTWSDVEWNVGHEQTVATTACTTTAVSGTLAGWRGPGDATASTTTTSTASTTTACRDKDTGHTGRNNKCIFRIWIRNQYGSAAATARAIAYQDK